MQSQHNNILPPAPSGKSGWPWSNESPDLAEKVEENDWPTISIVIPTFNQATYLEQTIRSVLLQAYPKCELIVIDGSSTDSTIGILKKYSSYLTYWVSEKDRGQTHAINKGMGKATGQLLAYLNSDDFYLPDTLVTVAGFAMQNPDVDVIYGGCLVYDSDFLAVVPHCIVKCKFSNPAATAAGNDTQCLCNRMGIIINGNVMFNTNV